MYEEPDIVEGPTGLWSLVRDWPVAVPLALRELDDEAFRVERLGERLSLVTTRRYASTPDDPQCDGPSRAPLVVLGVRLLGASVFHDRWYMRLEQIAAAWGVRPGVARLSGDRVFREIVILDNAGRPLARPVAWSAYGAVRVFGGEYHRRRLGA